MTKYYLTYGYPLVVAASAIVDGYIVEKSAGETLTLPNDIAMVWAQLLSCAKCDDKDALEKLAELELLYEGNSKGKLLEKCCTLRPLRQGIGSTFMAKDKNGEDRLYYSVRLGKENYTLSDFQRRFWIASAGNVAIHGILDDLALENGHLELEEMAKQIFLLVGYGLLFFKK